MRKVSKQANKHKTRKENERESLASHICELKVLHISNSKRYERIKHS